MGAEHAIFTGIILAGLTGGFRIGFNHRSTRARSNMRSAIDHPDIVNNYLLLEKTAGRIGVLTRGLYFPSNQPLWSHPQKIEARQMEADHRPVRTRGPQRQRRH